MRLEMNDTTPSAWLSFIAPDYDNSDLLKVRLYCDLMAVDEEEDEDEDGNNNNQKKKKKKKGGFKVEDITHLDTDYKWQMRLPMMKMNGTEIIVRVKEEDGRIVGRVREVVNNKVKSDTDSDSECVVFMLF